MADIIRFPFDTTLDLQAPEMLKAIAEENPKNVFVLVWPDGGGKPTYHSTTSDIPVILMRINEFTHKYYNGDFTTESN